MLSRFSIIPTIFYLFLSQPVADCGAGASADAGSEIIIRADVKPEDNIVAGQRVILWMTASIGEH